MCIDALEEVKTGDEQKDLKPSMNSTTSYPVKQATLYFIYDPFLFVLFLTLQMYTEPSQWLEQAFLELPTPGSIVAPLADKLLMRNTIGQALGTVAEYRTSDCKRCQGNCDPVGGGRRLISNESWVVVPPLMQYQLL